MSFGAIILAGGKSSRMGKDKGLLNYKDQSMLEYSIEALKGNCHEFSIVGANPEYDKFNIPRYEDETVELGPLGGIQKGLRMSKQEWNVILSTDIPNINDSIVKVLIKKRVSGLIRVSKCQGKVHPLVGLYSKQILPKLDLFLKEGGRSVMQFLNKVETEIVVFDDQYENCFLNVNTPVEFKNLDT